MDAEIKSELMQMGISRMFIAIVLFIALVFYVIKSVYELRNIMLENKLYKKQLNIT